MEEDDRDLPSWVVTLIRAAEEDAYAKGRRDGINYALEQAKTKLDQLGWSLG